MSCTDIDFYDHPIFDSDFTVETRGMKLLHDDLQERIWRGHLAATVYGYSRQGKSQSMKRIYNQFVTRKKEPIQGLFTSFAETDNKTIRDVNYNLLDYTNLSFNRHASSKNLATTLFEYLADLTLVNSYRICVLVIDEAQDMNVNQLNALKNLYNKVESFKYKVFFVLIANKINARPLLAKLKTNEHAATYNRFFCKKIDFHGIRTKRDIKYVLNQYDELHFPEGVSYTQFFAQDDYANGFRLVSLTDTIWEEYVQSYKTPYSLIDWPAEHFFGFINSLLPDYIFQFGASQLTDEMLKDALHKTFLDEYYAQEDA